MKGLRNHVVKIMAFLCLDPALWSEGLWNIETQKSVFAWKSQHLYSKSAVFSKLPKNLTKFDIDGTMCKMSSVAQLFCQNVGLLGKYWQKLVNQDSLNNMA